MSGPDCIDICDTVFEVMCGECPHCDKCQNCEDDANHRQMLSCLGYMYMKDGKYPDDFTPYYTDEEVQDILDEEQRVVGLVK
jgi:hypothetical protein